MVYNLSVMKILAIESSCDETAAAVVEDGLLKSNIVTSQLDLHRKYGGVFPELASRQHLAKIIPVIREVLEKAQIKLEAIDLFATTFGPGLIGSLLVGVETAKTLSFILKKPLLPINHLEGHIYANFVGVNFKSQIPNSKQNSSRQSPVACRFPAIVLIVSGGHTMLVLMKNHLQYKILGETLDDAAGEAFDKAAKILDLGYPGGPAIEKAAKNAKVAKNAKIVLPRPMLNSKDFDFSFSGLKTALLYQARAIKNLKQSDKLEFAKEFQDAIVQVLVTKTIRAATKYGVQTILLSGGVAANKLLREKLAKECKKFKFPLSIPEFQYCTDNAAMIATAAYFRTQYGRIPPIDNWKKVQAISNAKLN